MLGEGEWDSVHTAEGAAGFSQAHEVLAALRYGLRGSWTGGTEARLAQRRETERRGITLGIA